MALFEPLRRCIVAAPTLRDQSHVEHNNGYSYTETYASSDGSQGTRQYDAATGLASISWDSAATGSLSGASTTAVGFVGLQSEGELTNTQPDLNFFNPAASPGFSSFLSAAETHS